MAWTAGCLGVIFQSVFLVAVHCYGESLDVDWGARAQEALNKELNKRDNTNVAKNVIMFVGDGMGITTTTVARIYKGQKAGRVGEMSSLSFEDFPHVAMSKTFSNNMQVTASAAAATALLSGTKTTAGAIGLGPKIVRGNCSQQAETKIDSFLDWCMAAGKGTGIVTTTRVTHATPAAAYAHTADRNWETDADLPDDANGTCSDIAHQLVVDNSNINVILGGGRRAFLPTTTADPEYPDKRGKRMDDRDLTKEWVDDKKIRRLKHRYVWKEEDFRSVDTSRTDYLLGLFDYSHMQYDLQRSEDKAGEPSLAEMTEKAIRILKRQPKGFFLLVEGGRIDHAHHDNYAKKALQDTLAFDEAVTKATEMTDEADTLIVVTADHSHSFSMGSWASVNNPILGTVDDFGFDFGPTADGAAYLGLSYANGPGPEGRINATAADSTADDFQFPVLINMDFDTHGGEDVAMYARGPMSHLINGVQENQYITHVMAYAACVGQNKGHCSGSARYARSHDDVTCAGGALSPIGTAILVTWAVLIVKLLQD